MKKYIFIILTLVLPWNAFADEDQIELDTTRIKANQELPQILYIVPWKDAHESKQDEQKLVLHDFFGDLYDPVLPSQMGEDQQ